MKFQLIFFSFLITSCANIGILGGGPVDDKSPVLLKNNISKTNFNSRSIELEFDEFVLLNNAEKNIKIFPSDCKMSFNVTHKKVIIHFDTTLTPNTTYNLLIDKGIADVNANNPFVYNAIFSTGATLDSSKIRIQIKDITAYKNLKIALSKHNGLDSFKSFSSFYIQEIDKDIVEFNGLASNVKMNICLFTDENFDNKPDWYKPSNFIYFAAVDSLYSIQAYEWMKPFKINKSISDGRFTKIFYTKQYQYSKLISTYTGVKEADFLYYNADSAVFKGAYKLNATTKDSVKFIDIEKEIYKTSKESIRLIKNKDQILLFCNLPQYYSKIDSSQAFIPFQKTLQLKIDSVLILKNRLGKLDSFNLRTLAINDQNKLSFLSIQINDSLKQFFDLKIYKDDKEYLFLSGINKYSEYLEPAVYKLEIRKYNSMYSYDPFNMREKDIILYEKTLYLKAGWEEILTIKL